MNVHGIYIESTTVYAVPQYCMQVGDGVAQGDGLCSIFFGILTMYDMMEAERRAVESLPMESNNNVHDVPIMYAGDFNSTTPHEHRDMDARLCANYPTPLTDGVACCTKMTCAQIEEYLTHHGI